MRTFLTYVLAALAAALVGAVGQWLLSGAFVSTFIEGGRAGDPRLVAGSLAETIVSGLVAFALIGTVGSLVWLFTSRFVGGIFRASGLAGYAGFGALMTFATVMLVNLTFMLPTMEAYGVGAQTDVGNNLLGQLIVKVGLAWAIAGAAWGTVFWIRAPKPTTAGIAA